MRIYVPTPLQTYTERKGQVDLEAATLAALLAELNLRYPGIRFRMIDEQGSIRPHIKFFVNREQVLKLDTQLTQKDEIHIICALSGG